eukprot:6713234-Prymnesium_polylepis.1
MCAAPFPGRRAEGGGSEHCRPEGGMCAALRLRRRDGAIAITVYARSPGSQGPLALAGAYGCRFGRTPGAAGSCGSARLPVPRGR